MLRRVRLSCVCCVCTGVRMSTERLITNLAVREITLFHNKELPLSGDAGESGLAGDRSDLGTQRCQGGNCIVQDQNGRMRSYLMEDLMCIIEWELDECASSCKFICARLLHTVCGCCIITLLMVYLTNLPSHNLTCTFVRYFIRCTCHGKRASNVRPCCVPANLYQNIRE